MKITPELETLFQLTRGPVWDGNLVSKHARDELVRYGLVGRTNGWNFLTKDGTAVCVAIGLLKP